MTRARQKKRDNGRDKQVVNRPAYLLVANAIYACLTCRHLRGDGVNLLYHTNVTSLQLGRKGAVGSLFTIQGILIKRPRFVDAGI